MKNQRRIAWGALMTLLLGGAGVLQLQPVRAGGAIFGFSPGEAYLWNPSASAGNVSVRVFTLEPTGFSTLLGMVDLGSLGPESALNIKLAEDILDPLPGITTPYVANGGNLTLEFTIGAAGVRGAAQVFDNSLTLAFGTYALSEVPE